MPCLWSENLRIIHSAPISGITFAYSPDSSLPALTRFLEAQAQSGMVAFALESFTARALLWEPPNESNYREVDAIKKNKSDFYKIVKLNIIEILLLLLLLVAVIRILVEECRWLFAL